MKETKIYIGLNDSKTKKQIFEDEKYLSVLKNVCFNYHVAFSIYKVEGGYFHDNGDFVQENTLVLSLIDVDQNIAKEIAKDMCTFFNQETVILTNSEVDATFIRENIYNDK